MSIKYNIKNDDGFTMVELSIVLLIFGIIMMGFILSISAWGKKYEVLKNEETSKNIEQAITGFYAVTGRYPCPANPKLAQDDPDYGVEDCSMATYPGARDTEVDADAQPDPIYYGMLPTTVYETDDGSVNPELANTLKAYMPKYAIFGTDTMGTNQKPMIYAVTASMTRTETYNADSGVIRVTDERQQNTGGSNDNVHYVFVSNVDELICPVSTIVIPEPEEGEEPDILSGMPPPEPENCDGDFTFVDALFSSADGDKHFDDYVTYKISDNTAVWGPIGNTTDIRTKSAGKVSIGPTYDPDTVSSIKLDVDGNIKATRLVRSDMFCDNETGSCLNPKTIYNISCPNAGEYIKSTHLDGETGVISVVCEPLTFKKGQCGGGKYLKGIFTNGDVDCVPKDKQ